MVKLTKEEQEKQDKINDKLNKDIIEKFKFYKENPGAVAVSADQAEGKAARLKDEAYKQDKFIMKAENQRRNRAKNKMFPMGKKKGGIIKMSQGGSVSSNYNGQSKIQVQKVKFKGVF